MSKTLPSIAALLAATALSGCATVDFQSVGGLSATDKVEVQPETNVVQRSVETLQTAFTSRGLGETSSKRKMQDAANLLLNGLSARTTQTASQDIYSDRSVTVILEDLEIAHNHVDQTTRAAEVYLALAQADRNLEDELISLQSALLVSERAARLFDDALPLENKSDLINYKQSVDALRDVTDSFGDRVRLYRSDKVALNEASSQS